jgi:hypothetical protein
LLLGLYLAEVNELSFRSVPDTVCLIGMHSYTYIALLAAKKNIFPPVSGFDFFAPSILKLQMPFVQQIIPIAIGMRRNEVAMKIIACTLKSLNRLLLLHK